MNTYSLLLDWGNDSGLYGTVVQADSYEAAVSEARSEMHDADFFDGEPDEYPVVESYVGGNMWAAKQMLEALEELIAQAAPTLQLESHSPDELAAWDDARAAAKLGREGL